MSWANFYIEKLQNGEVVEFRPSGNSMSGLIENKQLCTVEPISSEPKVGDIVLCKVKGNQYLHLVKEVKVENEKTKFQIGNNKGSVNGWIEISSIFGTLTGVEK